MKEQKMHPPRSFDIPFKRNLQKKKTRKCKEKDKKKKKEKKTLKILKDIVVG